MQNVPPMLICKDERDHEASSRSFQGGMIGFAGWWGALSTLFLFYGANTLLFFLYTWPFFLALLPVSVVTGVGICLQVRGRLIWGAVVTAVLVTCLFWLLFFFLTGW